MEAVKKKVDFTEGRVFLKILFFVLPIVATNLLQTLYNAADMMVVSLSYDGQNAVGAIGTTNPFVQLIVNLFIGFSVGANVVVAREIGSKNRERVQNAVHTSVLLAAMTGTVGMILGVAISNPVMRLMGNTDRLLELSVRYTCIYFAGIPFLSMTNYLMAIFRAKGDAKTPLIVLTLAGLLNVGLNLFFVLVCDMSVEGVAIATALSNVASTVALLAKLARDKDDAQFSWKRLKMEKSSLKEIMLNGIPAGIQGALFSLSNMFIQSSIVKMNKLLTPAGVKDTPVVNGNAAATNLDGFIYTAMNAVYQGAITFTSQNVGANKPYRIRRILLCSLAIVTGVGMTLSGLLYLLRAPLLSLYGVKKGAEGELSNLAFMAATKRFQIVGLTYFLCGIMDVCAGVLRGMGRAVTSMMIALLGTCLFRLLWVWIVFPLHQTLDCIFIAYPISWGMTILVNLFVIWLITRKLLASYEAGTKVLKGAMSNALS